MGGALRAPVKGKSSGAPAAHLFAVIRVPFPLPFALEFFPRHLRSFDAFGIYLRFAPIAGAKRIRGHSRSFALKFFLFPLPSSFALKSFSSPSAPICGSGADLIPSPGYLRFTSVPVRDP
jgi:hypothetical protein